MEDVNPRARLLGERVVRSLRVELERWVRCLESPELKSRAVGGGRGGGEGGQQQRRESNGPGRDAKPEGAVAAPLGSLRGVRQAWQSRSVSLCPGEPLTLHQEAEGLSIHRAGRCLHRPPQGLPRLPPRHAEEAASPQLASISEDGSVVVLDSSFSEVFRNRSHRDFVTGLSWSPLNKNSLTTVGWDHQVLHHTVPVQKNHHSGKNNIITA